MGAGAHAILTLVLHFVRTSLSPLSSSPLWNGRILEGILGEFREWRTSTMERNHLNERAAWIHLEANHKGGSKVHSSSPWSRITSLFHFNGQGM